MQTLQQAFSHLQEGPCLVTIEGDKGAGKTHLVQQFYRELAAKEEQRFWPHDIAPDLANHEWQQLRKRVHPPRPDFSQEAPWLWLGTNCVGDASGDPLATLPLVGRWFADAFANDVIQPRIKARLTASMGDGLVATGSSLATEGITQALDATLGVPAASLLRTAFGVWHRVLQARKGRGAAVTDAAHQPAPAPYRFAFGVTHLLWSQLARVGTGGLTPAILVVEDAHLLPPESLDALADILGTNPDQDLLGGGHLAPTLRRVAAETGLPTVSPVLLILTGWKPNSAIRHDRSHSATAATDLRQWGDKVASSQPSLLHLTVTESELPRISEEEALRCLVETFQELTSVSAETLRIVIRRSWDSITERVHPGLLMGHGERVSRLRDPDATVDHAWAAQHLPPFLEGFERQRLSLLSSEGQQAAAKASLSGPSIPRDAVGPQWSELISSGLIAVEDSTDLEVARWASAQAAEFIWRESLADPVFVDETYGAMLPLLERLLSVPPSTRGFDAARVALSITARARMAYEGSKATPSTPAAELVRIAGYACTLEELDAESGTIKTWQRLHDFRNGREVRSSPLWASIDQYLIHKHVPGYQTWHSWMLTHSGSAAGPTMRMVESSHEAAASLVEDGLRHRLGANMEGELHEGDLRLLVRLRDGVRFLSPEARLAVASKLRAVGPDRATASLMLAYEFLTELGQGDRREVVATLLEALAIASPREPLLSAAAPGALLNLLRDVPNPPLRIQAVLDAAMRTLQIEPMALLMADSDAGAMGLRVVSPLLSGGLYPQADLVPKTLLAIVPYANEKLAPAMAEAAWRYRFYSPIAIEVLQNGSIFNELPAERRLDVRQLKRTYDQLLSGKKRVSPPRSAIRRGKRERDL